MNPLAGDLYISGLNQRPVSLSQIEKPRRELLAERTPQQRHRTTNRATLITSTRMGRICQRLGEVANLLEDTLGFRGLFRERFK